MIDISNLENAYQTLKKSYDDYCSNQDSPLIEYIADSCVKRFEYTLETSWKLAKRIFIQRYGKTEQELSMNNIFRAMQGYGYASDWMIWRDYYQKRNDTAHEYNLVKSRKLIDLIPKFLDDVEFFIKKIKEDINAD